MVVVEVVTCLNVIFLKWDFEWDMEKLVHSFNFFASIFQKCRFLLKFMSIRQTKLSCQKLFWLQRQRYEKLEKMSFHTLHFHTSGEKLFPRHKSFSRSRKKHNSELEFIGHGKLLTSTGTHTEWQAFIIEFCQIYF